MSTIRTPNATIEVAENEQPAAAQNAAALRDYIASHARPEWYATLLAGAVGMAHPDPETPATDDEICLAIEAADLAYTSQPEPPAGVAVLSSNGAVQLSHDVENPKLQALFNKASEAAQKLSVSAKRDLEKAFASKHAGERLARVKEFLIVYRNQLANLLGTTQLAAILEGMRQIAADMPPIPPAGGPPPPPSLAPEDARDLVEQLAELPPMVRAQKIYELPVDQQAYVRAAAASGGGKWQLPEMPTAHAGAIHFPKLDEAVKELAGKNVLPARDYYRMNDAAKQKAFTVARVAETETLEKIRDALAEQVAEGADVPEARARLIEAVGEGTFLSRPHLECVIRNGIQGAFSDGQANLLKHPGVRRARPYAAITPIHDDRVRPHHLAMETRGLNGTNVYLLSDPTFQLWRPPSEWLCRCNWRSLSIRRAAELGVEHAKKWLAEGVEPPPEHVEPPPFFPDPAFRRSGVPLSIQLSMEPIEFGHNWKPADGESDFDDWFSVFRKAAKQMRGEQGFQLFINPQFGKAWLSAGDWADGNALDEAKELLEKFVSGENIKVEAEASPSADEDGWWSISVPEGERWLKYSKTAREFSIELEPKEVETASMSAEVESQESPGEGWVLNRVGPHGGKYWVRGERGAAAQDETQRTEMPNATVEVDPVETTKKAKEEYKRLGTRATAFKAWFGDWENDAASASKVVNKDGEPQETHDIPGTGSTVKDKEGKPIVVYHGTSKGGFTAFDKEKIAGGNLYGPGFYFTEDKDVAQDYKKKDAVPAKAVPARAMTADDADKLAIYLNKVQVENSPEDEAAAKTTYKDKKVHDTVQMIWRYLEEVLHPENFNRPKIQAAAMAALESNLAAVAATGKNTIGVSFSKKVAEGAFNYVGIDLAVAKPKKELKAVYLNIRKPFDLDKPMSDAELDRVFGVAATNAIKKQFPYYKDGVQASVVYDRLPDMKNVGLYGSSDEKKAKLNQLIAAAGYDGLTHIGGDRMGGGHHHRVWIAFEPNQIKAVKNQGTFDPANANINLSHITTDQIITNPDGSISVKPDQTGPNRTKPDFSTTIGRYKIVTVCAADLRGKSPEAEEFGDFGTRAEFDFIPDGEIWIADTAGSERRFWIDAGVAQLQAIERGASREEAYDAGLAKEKAERERAAGAAGLPFAAAVYGTIRKTKLRELEDGTKIMLVDAKQVREQFKTDFSQSGHSEVYSWIPHDEVWVDIALHPREREHILLHELLERRLQRGGMDYDQAHPIASHAELASRHAEIPGGAAVLAHVAGRDLELTPAELEEHQQNRAWVEANDTALRGQLEQGAAGWELVDPVLRKYLAAEGEVSLSAEVESPMRPGDDYRLNRIGPHGGKYWVKGDATQEAADKQAASARTKESHVRNQQQQAKGKETVESLTATLASAEATAAKADEIAKNFFLDQPTSEKIKQPLKWAATKANQQYDQLKAKYGVKGALAIWAAGQTITWGLSIGLPAAGIPVIAPPGTGLATTAVLAAMVDKYRAIRSFTASFAAEEAETELPQKEVNRLAGELVADIFAATEEA